MAATSFGHSGERTNISSSWNELIVIKNLHWMLLWAGQLMLKVMTSCSATCLLWFTIDLKTTSICQTKKHFSEISAHTIVQLVLILSKSQSHLLSTSSTLTSETQSILDSRKHTQSSKEKKKQTSGSSNLVRTPTEGTASHLHSLRMKLKTWLLLFPQTMAWGLPLFKNILTSPC